MAFRPCIDLKDGRVVQIVGGTLTDDGAGTVTNHVSDRSAADFAAALSAGQSARRPCHHARAGQ